ncbi:hypothetical protein FRC04_012044 [Tulasnella sp. 424]|nr:hypothetical protein FRC04_012044 [Tulasnella sp. 424]KAG8971284.1 hypothetical protein FRC05_011383 [Tulasnella sp. 425]
MPSLAEVKSSNAAHTWASRPTALFVGGTSGCGQGTAEAFARATQGRAHILICGRNREAAERIIAEFPKHPESKYEFVQCDATLMKNVVKAAEEVKHKIGEADGKTKLNYLVLSQGIGSLTPLDPTSEGIDKKLALHFYSRWKVRSLLTLLAARLEILTNALQFVDELLPLLEKASSDGEEARVMSILAPGTSGALDTSDLGLKKNYSITRAARHGTGYNDNFVAEYAARHSNISFIHIMPGWVDTPLSKGLPWYLRGLAYSLSPFFARSISDCGEYMTSTLLNPAYKAGGFWLGQNGGPIAKRMLYVDDEDVRKKLVEHYTKEVAF